MKEKFCSQISGVDLEGKFVPVPCQGHDCIHYEWIELEHPQTGEVIKDWGCVFTHIALTGKDHARRTHELGAAIESFRNEVVDQHNRFSTGVASLIANDPHSDPKLLGDKK